MTTGTIKKVDFQRKPEDSNPWLTPVVLLSLRKKNVKKPKHFLPRPETFNGPHRAAEVCCKKQVSSHAVD